MSTLPVKRALLSVYDKAGILELAKSLIDLEIEIISTGGTSKILTESHIPHHRIEEITNFPEILDGRVKTLHPNIHGGILGKRDEHDEQAQKLGLKWIDLVVVNFYPFTHFSQKNELTFEQALEYIDIGGPTLVRAAAKNCSWVSVVVDPNDYSEIIRKLKHYKGLDNHIRRQLAVKAFALTSEYDAKIKDFYLKHLSSTPTHTLEHSAQQSDIRNQFNLEFTHHSELRYGENPHQRAIAYQSKYTKTGILTAKQHQGKALSYNNILDAESAWSCVLEFDQPTCVIVKHANPCGVATSTSIDDACRFAYQSDSRAAFGGIVAINSGCTKAVAEAITSIFTEVIIAPVYSPEALNLLATKPNLRVLEMPLTEEHEWEIKIIRGGMLRQEKNKDVLNANDLISVTHAKPSTEEIHSLLFAWKVAKHCKSNAIVIAKNNRTIGMGLGQVSRIDAVDIAVRKAGEDIQKSVLASDAFFPFRDSIDHIAQSGVKAIIQPGGSVRDDEVIAACNEAGIAMVFTGKRCFKH